MVHVFALYKAHPGMRAKVFEILRANTPAVKAEPGCVEYFASIDAKEAPGLQTPMGEDGFIVYECWADMNAFNAHANAPHVITYRDNTRALIAMRTVHVMSRHDLT
jgi:quinol monooxygenase YgiN